MDICTVRKIALGYLIRSRVNAELADDIASDIVIRVLSDDTLLARCSIRTLAKNALASHWRTLARHREIEQRIAIPMQFDCEQMSTIDTIDTVETLKATLTADQCVTLNTLANCDCNQAELARVLNVTPQAVTNRINKIREKISETGLMN